MARGKYLSLEEARKAGQLDQSAKEHPIDDVHPQAHPEATGRCHLRGPGGVEAAMRADECLAAGDMGGEAVWLRIVNAIEELLLRERPEDAEVH